MRELKKREIIAILRGIEPGIAPEIAKVLLEAGIRWMEVSLSNEEQGLACIRQIKKQIQSDELRLGVGTATNLKQVDRAVEAGASFIITPGWDRDLVRGILQRGLPVFPGVLTPGDVMQAMQEGIQVCKLFPADVMGFEYVKSLKGPFPNMEFIAVGGVDIKNYLSCLEQGFHAAGIGGSLVPRGATVDDLSEIERKAKQLVEQKNLKDETSE